MKTSSVTLATMHTQAYVTDKNKLQKLNYRTCFHSTLLQNFSNKTQVYVA